MSTPTEAEWPQAALRFASHCKHRRCLRTHLASLSGTALSTCSKIFDVGAEELVWIGEGLEGGRPAQRDGAIQFRLAVLAVGDAVAAGRQGASGPILVHPSVDIGMSAVAGGEVVPRVPRYRFRPHSCCVV